MVKKFTRLAPIRLIVIESVKFDTQALDNPLISGIEYQQGTLSGYTQYLLERFNHRRVYRDAKNVPLEIDHVIPKSKGGSDRVSNLVIARGKRDQKKGNRDLDDFLGPRSNVAKKIERGEKLSLADAAAMNSIRKATIKSLKDLELPAREAAISRDQVQPRTLRSAQVPRRRRGLRGPDVGPQGMERQYLGDRLVGSRSETTGAVGQIWVSSKVKGYPLESQEDRRFYYQRFCEGGGDPGTQQGSSRRSGDCAVEWSVLYQKRW